MQLKAKSIHLSSVVCCYIAAIVGCMFISCECKNGDKKITSPMEEIQVPSDNSGVPLSSSDLTIETKKSILLGKDTLLPVTFLTTNKEIHLEDYTLKITLEDKKDNTSKVGVQGTSGLQNSMEKPLIAFADLLTNSPTQLNDTRGWQLDLNLQPASGCNELDIRIELLNSKTAALIKAKTVTWKNIQVNFTSITYDPITSLLTCIIQNIGNIPAEQLTLKYQNISLNEAILSEANGQSTTFNLPEYQQEKRVFVLDFKGLAIAEFKFELIYQDATLAMQTILLKNIQISLEGLIGKRIFKGNELVKCFLKNKGSYPFNTADLIVSIEHPECVLFVLTQTSLKNYVTGIFNLCISLAVLELISASTQVLLILILLILESFKSKSCGLVDCSKSWLLTRLNTR